MKLSIKKGTTSKLVQFVVSDSSSTTGAFLTGLVYNAAGLTAYYYREGAASAAAITLVTMTLGTWASGGFVVVDATNMAGTYQLGIPDAALATGADSVLIYLKGATNMAPLPIEIELTEFDNQDVVRGGLTALPASGTLAVNPVLASGTHTGAVIPTVSTLTGHTPQTGDSFARLGVPAGVSISADIADIPTVAEFNARTIASASYFDPATDTVTVGTNNDKTGYSLTQAFPTNFADLAITATTGKVTVGTNNDKTGYSLTQTFPTNFADLAITATTGLVDVNDKTGYSLTQTFPTNFADLAITATTGLVDINDKTGYSLSVTGVDAVWDEPIAGHLTAGSTGEKLNSAASAGDPWSTALPGTYGAGTAGKIVGDNINATISSRMAEASINTTAGAVDNVTLVGTTTTNTDMRGTDGANTVTPLTAAQVNAEVDAALDTAIPGTPTANSINERIAAIDDLTQALGAGDLAAILADTNELQTNQGNWLTATGFSTHTAADVWTATTRALTDKAGFTISGTKTTLDSLNDIAASEILTAALTESYATDGSAFTLSQALYMLWASLSEFAVTGTTITAKKLDGATPAMTFTLDDGTNPTSRTRAT